MAGRRPTPTALKVLRGNPGGRPLPEGEAQPQVGRPSQPEWLSAEAKREWTRVSRELLDLRLLTVVDRAALAGYCQWWARWREAEQRIDELGPVVETPTSNGPMLVPSPWVRIAQQASDRCRKFLIEFGLTPAARAKAKAIPAESESDPILGLITGTKRDG